MKRGEFKDTYDPAAEKVAIDAYIKKLEREAERLKRQQGTDERLFQSVKDAIGTIPVPKKIACPRPKLKHDDLHVCLSLCDAHADEAVRAEEMEGLAHYDFAEFERRMDVTAAKTVELTNIMRQASNVARLDIWCLGDWLLGKIQPQEEGYGASLTMPVALPKVGMVLGRFVVGISAHFDHVRVVGVVGNHGRDTARMPYKMTADRNWDKSVYLIAEEFSRECSNVEWVIPESIFKKVDILGWGCLLAHSGEVNMNNRVPYYPIETTFDLEKKLRRGTPEDFTFAFVGHWHHHAVIDSDIIICPSMIGPNQFSRFKLHRASSAEQLLTFFTKKHGLVTQWPIKLS